MNNIHPITFGILSTLAISCGGGTQEVDQSPVEPPDNPSRVLPFFGPPDDEEMTVKEFDPPPSPVEMGETASAEQDLAPLCCAVTFAIADENSMEDEVAVKLHGSAYPLSQGLELTYVQGVWSVDTCIRPEYKGNYSYTFEREVEGELVEEFALNPFAPRSDAFGFDANVWITSDSCAESTPELHAVTEAQ